MSDTAAPTRPARPASLDRREFLGAIGIPTVAAAAGVSLDPFGLSRVLAAGADPSLRAGSATGAADNEDLWSEVGRAFTMDRTLINLNNGGVSPAPLPVQDAMKRALDRANSTPPPIALWTDAPPLRDAVRRRLAAQFGCDAEEVAITRNASESLQICQFGFDLKPGDEVLTTNQDYPRMINAFKQRERREGIVLRQISIPVPCEDPAEIVRRFEQAITDRTRLILMCHMVNLTGQVLPVKEVVSMARAKGIPVLIDGAHALAHLDFRISDLDCDYYAASLHKWLFAPIGTGFLYVRRDRIRSLWPLTAPPPSLDDNIRKFEEIGTHPAANFLAIGEALTFHQAIGPARKQARLAFLRDHWARRLLAHDRVRLHTSLKPGFACGLANFEVDGAHPEELQKWLWQERRILTTPIMHDEFRGIRVTPSVYTTLEELDRFCEAIEYVLKHGMHA